MPVGDYAPGSPEFRYWNAAEALRRGCDFWRSLLQAQQWQRGRLLGVDLDKGVDLNAYYDRKELAFFHQTVEGQTIYSGESPDVLCHEMGHAILDAHRPELFDAPFVEAAAFHESFGDMSALLSALQLEHVRTAALAAVRDFQDGPLPRCAEQLGWAIRQMSPGSVEKHCLRNAYNAFHYTDPQQLPNSAPATRLSAEPHSFSRIFTGAFYEILGGMVRQQTRKPKPKDLATAAQDLARLLLHAVAQAPIQPDYFAQIAAHTLDADADLFSGKYRPTLTDVLVRRRLLPASAVADAAPAAGIQSLGGRLVRQSPPAFILLDPQEFGLPGKSLRVAVPGESRQFNRVAASLGSAVGGASATHQAALRFVHMLFACNRVGVAPRSRLPAIARAPDERPCRRTHLLHKGRAGLELSRKLFHCAACQALD